MSTSKTITCGFFSCFTREKASENNFYYLKNTIPPFTELFEKPNCVDAISQEEQETWLETYLLLCSVLSSWCKMWDIQSSLPFPYVMTAAAAAFKAKKYSPDDDILRLSDSLKVIIYFHIFKYWKWYKLGTTTTAALEIYL